MTKIKEETSEEEKTTEKIELLMGLMDVRSSVKANITQDYTLASLTTAEKEFIEENYQNAEFAKELIKKFGKKGYYYSFNDKKGDWERDSDGVVIKFKLEKGDIEKIEDMSKRLFEFFMVHPHMIAILNRNKTENFLVKLLGKSEEEEKPVVFGQDDRSTMQKIRDKIFGEEVYEEQ